MSGWWRPDRPAWWVGTLFAIGSILFLVRALAALGSTADWIGVTFFCGSIFFTSASVLRPGLAVMASPRPRLVDRGPQPAGVGRVRRLGDRRFRPTRTGEAVSDQIANAGTALGALCFLIGAVLLLPQAERQQEAGD